MVLYHQDSVFIKNIFNAEFLENLYRRRSRNVITQNVIKTGFNKISGGNAIKTCMVCKNLLRHGHRHTGIPPDTI